MKEIIVENKKFVGDPNKFKGTRDDNALGFAWRPGWEDTTILIDNCEIDANGVAEGLKLSYCKNVKVTNCTIIGGYEDCVDIVRGSNIVFHKCKFIANNTKHHFTIKCNVDGVKIIDCEFINEFNNILDGACVDLGNWGDYDVVDLPKTRNIEIVNCKFTNFRKIKKIITRRLYAETPSVACDSGYKLNIPTIFVSLFWSYKRYENKHNK
jgi:hypothetical protein